jgi:hypothetical protein
MFGTSMVQLKKSIMYSVKKALFLVNLLLFFLVIQSVKAQNFGNESPLMPLNPKASPVFGKDIVINNLADQDQRTIAICSAPNGWLYAGYSFDSLNSFGLCFVRSKDNGISWKQIFSIYADNPGAIMHECNLIVTGNDSTDQKLFCFYSCYQTFNNLNSDIYGILRFSCDPCNIEEDMYTTSQSPYHDIAIAWDNGYPAINSSPNSVGFLYSKSGVKDSLIFLSSGDGGMTLNNRKVVAISTKKIHKVALAYGRSFSQNAGQYYAVWEEMADTVSDLGHIYTAHTTPYFNSAFSTPVMLDGLDTSLTNLCRNPVIACQANNSDNDSANLSEIILFEKYNSGTGDYDLTGFYNKKAAMETTFKRLNVATGPGNQLQADITFNPFDSTFILTYYDSTTQKLVLLNKNMNLDTPGSWNEVSGGYNDSYTLTAPNPRICINMEKKNAVCNWIADRENENGIALFDAPYIPNTGIIDSHMSDDIKLAGTSPNPCSTSVTISFTSKTTERVMISLYNVMGQKLKTISDQSWQPGLHQVKYDVSQMQNGVYVFTLSSETCNTSGKICISR